MGNIWSCPALPSPSCVLHGDPSQASANVDVVPADRAASSATPQRADVRPEQPCPVGYCRAGAGHRTLHDIAPCLKTCGPLRPGKGREHNPACPNHNFYGETP